MMVAAHRARQLAGGRDHRWPNQDQHEQRGYDARHHVLILAGPTAAFALRATAPKKAGHYNAARRRRNALAITDTELNVIAALAIMGLRSRPKTGYSTPAAIGTPSTL